MCNRVHPEARGLPDLGLSKGLLRIRLKPDKIRNECIYNDYLAVAA